MTKNEAYLYARKLRRSHLTNQQLEAKMKAEGYTDADYSAVKYWISHKPAGV